MIHFFCHVNKEHIFFSAICPAGEEYVSVSKTCKECPLGSYKSEYGNNKACTPCPIAYTTGFTGSISVNNCSFRKFIKSISGLHI